MELSPRRNDLDKGEPQGSPYYKLVLMDFDGNIVNIWNLTTDADYAADFTYPIAGAASERLGQSVNRSISNHQDRPANLHPNSQSKAVLLRLIGKLIQDDEK